ncbi:hypothetical protein, partial [uncultured Agathobaculum sp.]|uniref:hypothetical protein n=1 Tax=uncultured Agathobaculum sp. TaxID=2048140 RepID=UPI003207FBC5
TLRSAYCRRSSSIFIFLSTMVNFITSSPIGQNAQDTLALPSADGCGRHMGFCYIQYTTPSGKMSNLFYASSQIVQQFP